MLTRRIDELRAKQKQEAIEWRAQAPQRALAKAKEAADRKAKLREAALKRAASIQALREASARLAKQARIRRLRVLGHLCRGLCPKQAAKLENVSLRSIHRAMDELRKMSGAKTQHQLGAWAVASGHFTPGLSQKSHCKPDSEL